MHNTFFYFSVKFRWHAIGQGLVESHPDSLEFLLLNGSLSPAQRFRDAIKHDTCCPCSWKEMPQGCPSASVGRAAPSFLAAAVTSASPKRPCTAQQRQSVPLSPCLAETCFPFCRECRALQSRTPGRGCSFLCFCTSPPSELLRLSGTCHVIPQAGTGMICASGSRCCCPSRWALAPQRQSSPPSQRLAPQGAQPHGSREGSTAV